MKSINPKRNGFPFLHGRIGMVLSGFYFSEKAIIIMAFSCGTKDEKEEGEEKELFLPHLPLPLSLYHTHAQPATTTSSSFVQFFFYFLSTALTLELAFFWDEIKLLS